MPQAKPLKKEDIERAMRLTRSNKGAARYLNVSYQHYRKYARLYTNSATGKTLLEEHANYGAKGVPKLTTKKLKIASSIKGIVDGTVDPSVFNPDKIKERLIVDGYLKEECYKCNFNERRVLDYRTPLILNFKDKDKHNYSLGNIELLCYNCYFLYVGVVFTEKDIKQLETDTKINKTTDDINMELDDYNIKRLKEITNLDSDNDSNEEDPYSIVSKI